MSEKQIDLSAYKKLSAEDLQGLLHLRKRGGKHGAKRGKGSYNRKKFKKGDDDYE